MTDRRDIWYKSDQHRFEDNISRELHELRAEVQALATRFAWMLGGLGVLVFVVNVGLTIWLRYAAP